MIAAVSGEPVRALSSCLLSETKSPIPWDTFAGCGVVVRRTSTLGLTNQRREELPSGAQTETGHIQQRQRGFGVHDLAVAHHLERSRE